MAVGVMWLDCPDGAAGTSADTGVSAIVRCINVVGVLVDATSLADIGIWFTLVGQNACKTSAQYVQFGLNT